jgi:hypothetical protein
MDPSTLEHGAHILGYTQLEQAEEYYEASLQEVVGALRGGRLTLTQVVAALGEVLTSTQDARRHRGTLLLAEVVGQVRVGRIWVFMSVRGILLRSLAALVTHRPLNESIC